MPKFIRQGLKAVEAMIERIAEAIMPRPQPVPVPVRVASGKSRR